MKELTMFKTIKEDRKTLAVESRLQRKLLRSKRFALGQDGSSAVQSHLYGVTRQDARAKHLALTYLRMKSRSYCERTRNEMYCSSCLYAQVLREVRKYWEGSPMEAYTQHQPANSAFVAESVHIWMNT